MQQLVHYLQIRILDNFNNAKNHLFTLSILIAVGFCVFFAINYFSADYQYDSLILRLVAGVMTIPFLLPEKLLPRWFNRIAPLYFHFLLLYTFSFFFAFLFFKNPYSYMWTANVLVGLSILMFLVDWSCYLIMTIVGFLAAFLCFILTTENPVLPSYIPGVLISYLSPTVYFMFRERVKKEKNMRVELTKKLNQELEQKIQERTVELQQALTVKTEFLNNISHEIRAPINGFSMAADNLMNHWSKLGVNQRYEMVQIIAKSAKRINNLTNHLLELSKLTTKKKILNLQELNLGDSIRDIIEECKDLYLQDKKIEFVFEAQAEYYVEADKEMMGQVLRNILTNSIKFSPNDSVVTLKVIEQNDELILTISDSGVGIPESELEVIFNPFTQSSRTNNYAGGTGLGLAIAQQIIQQHNGAIYAKNNEKSGCSFVLVIPRLKVLASKIDINGKILIIDDEEIALNVVKAGLMLNGFNVSTALGGIEGLKCLQEQEKEISIVLLDLMMPDIYGLDVLKVIKEKYPQIMVIIQSGIADEGEIGRAMSLGAHSILRKPYRIGDVIAAMRTCREPAAV